MDDTRTNNSTKDFFFYSPSLKKLRENERLFASYL